MTHGASTDRPGSFLDADHSRARGQTFYVRHMNGEDVILRTGVSRPAPDGARLELGHGRLVTVSPDGSFLASVSDPDGPVEDDHPVINDLAISPDSTRLAFGYAGGGGVFVLDLVSGRSLADTEPVLESIPGSHSPAWVNAVTLAVIDIDGVVKRAHVDGFGTPEIYELAGYAEALDADDGGRLMVKLQSARGGAGVREDTDPTSFAMVGYDGEADGFMFQPFRSLVW